MLKKILTTTLLVIMLIASIWVISSRDVAHTGFFIVSDFYINLDSVGFVLFGGIIALSVYMGNFKKDIFIFISGAIIGLLVEWYGITREIWSYPHGQQLPYLLMPLVWGTVALSMYHLSFILKSAYKRMKKSSKK